MASFFANRDEDENKYTCLFAKYGDCESKDVDRRSAAAGGMKCVNFHVEALSTCHPRDRLRDGHVLFNVRTAIAPAKIRKSPNTRMEKNLATIPIIGESLHDVYNYTDVMPLGMYALRFAVKRNSQGIEIFIDGATSNLNIRFDLSAFDTKLMRKVNASFESIIGPLKKNILCQNMHMHELWFNSQITLIISVLSITAL